MLGSDLPEEASPTVGLAARPQIEEAIKPLQGQEVPHRVQGLLYDLLEDGTYPNPEDQAPLLPGQEPVRAGHVPLGPALHFMQVVRKGPKNPYFKYALPQAGQPSPS